MNVNVLKNCKTYISANKSSKNPTLVLNLQFFSLKKKCFWMCLDEEHFFSVKNNIRLGRRRELFVYSKPEVTLFRLNGFGLVSSLIPVTANSGKMGIKLDFFSVDQMVYFAQFNVQ